MELEDEQGRPNRDQLLAVPARSRTLRERSHCIPNKRRRYRRRCPRVSDSYPIATDARLRRCCQMEVAVAWCHRPRPTRTWQSLRPFALLTLGSISQTFFDILKDGEPRVDTVCKHRLASMRIDTERRTSCTIRSRVKSPFDSYIPGRITTR